MSEKHLSLRLEITEPLANQRLDKVLASLKPINTRSRADKLIRQGLVQTQARKIKPSTETRVGEVYEIQIPVSPVESDLKAWDHPLNILFEDEEVIVLNKPAGLVVHPSAGHAEQTLVNALLHHTNDLAIGFNELRPGIVHRLDKDTSGILVIAKTNQALLSLSQQFKERSVHRIYWALVFGNPHALETQTITSFLRRHPNDRKRFASGTQGKKAVTHYRNLKSFPEGISWLECKLETGRTHQIRVHLSEAGFPILGDLLYGSSRRVAKIANPQLRDELKALRRIGLHACELGFIHPSGKKMHFKIDWPGDLSALLNLLGLKPQNLAP